MIRKGLLSDLFVGIGVKKLAAVDADPSSSNQHEVTGSKPLLRILGENDRKLSRDGTDNRFLATYMWLGGEQEAISEEGELSWYDSRRNVQVVVQSGDCTIKATLSRIQCGRETCSLSRAGRMIISCLLLLLLTARLAI